MGVDYLYCGNCEECEHEDYFRQCGVCDCRFDADCCGYLCDNCDDENKKKITYEGKEYYLYLHRICYKYWYTNSDMDDEQRKDIIDQFGKLVEDELELNEI